MKACTHFRTEIIAFTMTTDYELLWCKDCGALKPQGSDFPNARWRLPRRAKERTVT